MSESLCCVINIPPPRPWRGSASDEVLARRAQYRGRKGRRAILRIEDRARRVAKVERIYSHVMQGIAWAFEQGARSSPDESFFPLPEPRSEAEILAELEAHYGAPT